MTALPSRLLRGLPPRIASLRVTVACLAILCVLTIWGTVYQVEAGLYAAQVRFFHSWIVWLWFLPLPGTQLVLWILFFNLTASLIFRVTWTPANVGNILTHAGLLFLLAGSWVTYQFAVESYLPLVEKEVSNASLDRRQWEIASWRKVFEQEDRNISAADVSPDQAGTWLDFGELGFRAFVSRYHRHSDAIIGPPDPLGLPNAEGINHLKPLRPRSDPEENLPGVVLRIQLKDGTDRELLFYGGQEKPNTFRVGGETVEITLRRKHWPLPFAVKLLDVRRKDHPGTRTPRSYESDVEVLSDGGALPTRIFMNHPLRYRGFTLFQSGYSIDGSGQETSVFAVVENRGQMIPYVSSLLIFGGMAIHFTLMLFGVRVRKTREETP